MKSDLIMALNLLNSTYNDRFKELNIHLLCVISLWAAALWLFRRWWVLKKTTKERKPWVERWLANQCQI